MLHFINGLIAFVVVWLIVVPVCVTFVIGFITQAVAGKSAQQADEQPQ